MSRQMRMLYARSNRLVRLFHSCSRNVLLELGRSFVVYFTVVIYGHTTARHHFLKFALHTMTYIVKVVHVSRRSSASEMFVNNNVSTVECLISKDV